MDLKNGDVAWETTINDFKFTCFFIFLLSIFLHHIINDFICFILNKYEVTSLHGCVTYLLTTMVLICNARNDC